MKIKQDPYLIFLLPAAITACVLIIYPICYGFYLSFFDTNLINKWIFVGFQNFTELLKNSHFKNSLIVNIKYIIIVVVGHLILGIWFALLLNKEVKGRVIFRSIMLMPWLIPEVVYAILWKWIMNPQYGMANYILMYLGVIEQPLSWFGDTKLALPIVSLISILKGFPFVMLMVLSALQTIPANLYEAAELDGCGPFKSFFYITLPYIMPVLAVTLIIDAVSWFKHFTMINLTTGGGPSETTNLLSVSIYQTAFDAFNFGSAASMAVIVFFICYFIGWLFRRLAENEN